MDIESGFSFRPLSNRVGIAQPAGFAAENPLGALAPLLASGRAPDTMIWRPLHDPAAPKQTHFLEINRTVETAPFMKKALKRQGLPEVITTDGLRSYRAAMNELGNAEEQEVGRWANSRVKNSHLPFRRRGRAMLRFRQMNTLQKFASVHANVHKHFSLERHLVNHRTFKERRSGALAEWRNLAS